MHVDEDRPARRPPCTRAISRSATRNGSSIACRNTRPMTLMTPTRTPLVGSDHAGAGSGSAVRIVGRPNQPRLVADEFQRLALVPHVIAGGDHVHAGREDLEHVLARDARAAGGVLAVGDHQIGAVVRGERAHVTADQIAARAADDVAEEEQFHSRDVAAIRSERAARRRADRRCAAARRAARRWPVAPCACAPSIAALILTARAKRPKSRSTR